MNNYPKVEITALVVTYDSCSGLTTVVKAIDSEDTDTCVSYPNALITLEQITEAAIMLHKDDKQLGRLLRAYLNGQDVQLDGYAGLLPSVGGVTVSIQTKMLDWT